MDGRKSEGLGENEGVTDDCDWWEIVEYGIGCAQCGTFHAVHVRCDKPWRLGWVWDGRLRLNMPEIRRDGQERTDASIVIDDR